MINVLWIVVYFILLGALMMGFRWLLGKVCVLMGGKFE